MPAMQPETVTLLTDLNRRFYNRFAETFSASRGATEPGLERALAQVQTGDRVLDLGCGQGRIALQLPPGVAYVGVDYAVDMLAVARREAEAAGVDAVFVTAGLLDSAWEAKIPAPFEWVVLRAVLHHIPGYENRAAILRRAAGVLAPGGRIILANWQFLQIERLRRRLLPWATIGLSAEDVEPGDYLLDWRREGHGHRYVHLVDEAETLRLAEDAGLDVAQLYRADGHTNDLTLYAILSRPQLTTR